MIWTAHGSTRSDRNDRRRRRRGGVRDQRLQLAGDQGREDSPYRLGAQLFLTHCSGCHSLSAVGAEGSATSVQGRLRTQAPNFNFRPECVATVLYAIRNGGFSGEIMPQNIVVGYDAKEVALFLHKYAGRAAPKTPTVGANPAKCTAQQDKT